MKRKLRTFAIVFLLWLAAMAFVLYGLGTEQAMVALSRVNVYYVFIAVGIMFGSKLVYLLNMKWLLHFLGGRASMATMFRVTFIGMFVDNVLPTILPLGETAMGYVMYHKGVPLPKAMAAVVAQGISWFVGFIVLFLGVFAYILMTGQIAGNLALIALIPFSLFCIFLLFFVYLTVNVRQCKQVIRSILCRLGFLISKIFGRRRTEKQISRFVFKTVEDFHIAICPFLSKKTALVLSFLILAFHHLLVALSFFFILLAFGISMPIELVFFMLFVINLVSLVSFIPGGLGVYEAVSISLLSINNSLIVATLATSLFRIIEYWITVFIGGILAIETEIEEVLK